MKYITIPPCQELKEVVSHFWMLRQGQEKRTDAIHYLTANSMAEWTFLFADKLEKSDLLFSSFQGQTDRSRQFPANPSLELFGVSIFPHAIPRLFDTPAYELNNISVSVEELWDEKTHPISEKVAHAPSIEAKINVFSAYIQAVLADKIDVDNTILQAFQQIHEQEGRVDIRKLSNESCLSERQFERRFKNFAGFSPKRYARIVRFESALNTHYSAGSLTETAFSHGYYDQAHFIREFKALSGMTPSSYFSLAQS